MFVNEVNDVKIYNLSAGKTVPEWLTDRRKRNQLAKKVDSRLQIELIQDFDMPTVATSIRMSPDQQCILATGTYKPRLKCFEVCNLSLKFERCFDSEVTTFEAISDDFSKIALLQCDRSVEIHSASGRHYSLRIPHFGRGMRYHKPSCDLFMVGTSKNIYRLNLERGQFLQPFETKASCLNACDVSSEHGLLLVGAKEGIIEAWDPRSKTRCGFVDVAMSLVGVKNFPSVSTLSFKNGLQIGVGTESGHVLLYDIRSRNPLIVKNHLNGVAIKRIAFNASLQTVYSMDEVMLKLWNEQTGKQVAYVEAATKFNDFCTINSTGMFFIAQEDVKMLTYYIPAMGPSPRWCSFLDNLTEEIESEVVEHIFDDYQFVTTKELEDLGLENLIGTNFLKGYMHGYFMDVRLYNKAKAVAEPFAFDRFRKEKIRKEMENERQPRLQFKNNIPGVNQELALKIATATESSHTTKLAPSLLEDSRFKALFENTDFVINRNAEEYKLLEPVINRLEKSKLKGLTKPVLALANELQSTEEAGEEESDNDDQFFELSGVNAETKTEVESTDDEDMMRYTNEIKRAYKEVKKQREFVDKNESIRRIEPSEVAPNANKKTDLEILKKNSKMVPLCKKDRKPYIYIATTTTLQDRAKIAEKINSKNKVLETSQGNRKMLFNIQKSQLFGIKKRECEMRKHRQERKALIRPTKSL